MSGSKLDVMILGSGGRVLSISAVGNTLEQARERAYDAADCINFDGMQYRRDIGSPALVAA